MFGTQNETSESQVTSRELRVNSRDATHRRSAPRSITARGSQLTTRNASQTHGFTLTELLVVITIIAILASLITGAALRALQTAKKAAITTELKQLDGALQDFKNEYGMYPPNIYATGTLTNNDQTLNGQVLVRALKKISSRSTEFQINDLNTSPTNNVFTIVDKGLSPAEALVFWLQGFSSDISRPLSGTDLVATRIDDNGTFVDNVITIDSFKPRFDFDRGRLRFSRDSDPPVRRFLTVQRPGDNTDYQIQLYEYFPKNSQQPYVYFDTSRETPLQVVNKWETTEFFYTNPITGGTVFPIKQLRADTPQPADRQMPLVQYVDYVEKGKFQILHAGLDDIWGNFSSLGDGGVGGELDVASSNGENSIPNLLAPEGPFIGDVADTLGSFMAGTLEDKQE